MSGDNQPLLENAFSRTRTHLPRSVSGQIRKKTILNGQKENALNIDEKYVFFVIARSCRMYALYVVIWSHATSMTGELNVLQYARYYGVFEMPNVDKMDQWASLVCQRIRSFSKLVANIMKRQKN